MVLRLDRVGQMGRNVQKIFIRNVMLVTAHTWVLVKVSISRHELMVQMYTESRCNLCISLEIWRLCPGRNEQVGKSELTTPGAPFSWLF